MQNHPRLAAALLAASLLVVPVAANAAPEFRVARAVLQDGATGATVGWALFSETGGRGVQVVVVAFGLGEGVHGLHIHTIGSCVRPDLVSAGPHFNPLNVPHGSHGGDLPNLPVGPGGFGHLVTSSTRFSLLPGQLSIFDSDGAALVIHAGQDDHMTNPTGNSGARIACGVITPLSLWSFGISGR